MTNAPAAQGIDGAPPSWEDTEIGGQSAGPQPKLSPPPKAAPVAAPTPGVAEPPPPTAPMAESPQATPADAPPSFADTAAGSAPALPATAARGPLDPFPESPDLKKYVENNVQVYNAIKKDQADDKPETAHNFEESFMAALQASSGGLAIRQQLPHWQTDPSNQTRAMKIAGMIGSFAGDLPAMAAGFLAGGAAGTAGGTAIGTATGGPIGGIVSGAVGGGVGAYAGAGALPPALRKMMMDHFEKGDIKDSSDFFNRAAATSWEALKGGITGTLTSIAGPLAGEVAAPLAGPVIGKVASFLGEAGVMTTTGAALEGRTPDAEEFLNGALMVGGLHGMGAIAPKLRNIYAATGERPFEVVQAAENDVQLKQDLISRDPTTPPQAHPSELNFPDVDEVLKKPEEPAEGAAKEPELTAEEKMAAAQPTLEPKDMSFSADDGFDNEEKPPEPKDDQFSEDQKYFLDQIGEEKDPNDGKSMTDIMKDGASDVNDAFHNLYARTLDRGAALRRILDKAGVDPKPEDSVQLMQLIGASGDTTQSFIEDGTRDFNTGKKNGEAFEPIVNDYRKAFPDDPQMKGLKAYGIAARTLELSSRGKDVRVNGETIDVDRAQRLVDVEGEKYQPFLDRTVAYGNRVLDYVHSSGFWTDKQLEAMKKMNESHFSFSRIMEEDELSGKTPGSRNPVQRIEGAGGFFKDPIASQLRNTDALVRMAEENRVKTQFVKDLISSENRKDFIEQIPDQVKPIQIGESELKNALNRTSVDTSDEDLSAGITVFRKSWRPLADNQFEVYQDGERKVFATHPIVAEAINSMADNPPALQGYAKLLGVMPAVLRVGTVNNPLFGLRHVYRNNREAPIYSQTGLKPVIDILRYAPAFFAGGDDYQNAKYEGAFVSHVMPIDQTYTDGKVYELDKEAPFLGRAWNFTKSAGAISHWAITLNDNMLRFAENQRALGQGKSPTEAAYLARNVIPDYQKAGIQKSALLASAAFVKVKLNSEARLVSAFKDDFQGTVIRGLTYVTLPSLMLYAANQNDDRVNDQSDHQKTMYDMMAVDHWCDADEKTANAVKGYDKNLARQKPDGSYEINDGPIVRMPTPFTLGMIFGRGPTAALDAWRKKDPGAVKEWAKTVAGQMFENVVPTAAVPIVEQMTNYNMYTGRPIVSALDEKGLPELQEKPFTSEVAKQLGKISHAMGGGHIGPGDRTWDNPLIIDNTMKYWGGALGKYATQLADAGLHAAGIGNTAPKPEMKWADTPFVEEFLLRNPSDSIQAVTDFNKNYEQASQILQSQANALKHGDTDTLKYIAQNYPDGATKLKDIKDGMSQQMKYIQSVVNNQTMTPTDKTQTIDRVLYGFMAAAKRGNKIFADIQNRKSGNVSADEGAQ